MKDERTFGQRLRETRVKAGLSQSDLEEISGIPKARLSRYENGHVAPSIQTLERLSKALGVSEASLLGDQRAPLEEFFNVLYARGIRLGTREQAARLGNAVADIIQSVPQADVIDSGAMIVGGDGREESLLAVGPQSDLQIDPLG